MNYTVDDNTESKLNFLCVLVVETFPETHLPQDLGIKYYKISSLLSRSQIIQYICYVHTQKSKSQMCQKFKCNSEGRVCECLPLFYLFLLKFYKEWRK